MPESSYLTILVTFLVCTTIVVLPILLKSFARPAKTLPFECGVEVVTNAPQRINVKYYIVGIIFTLFNVVAAFVYAWAVSVRDIGWTGFYVMLCFLALVEFGLLYMWKRGVFDWLN